MFIPAPNPHSTRDVDGHGMVVAARHLHHLHLADRAAEGVGRPGVELVPAAQATGQAATEGVQVAAGDDGGAVRPPCGDFAH